MAHPFIDAHRREHGTYHPGWGGPEFSSWQDEQLSWKTTCYVGDWSFLWDVVIEGPDALKVFRDSSINSFEKFAIGQAKHLVQCDDNGKVICDGVLLRLAEDRFATQGATAHYSAWLVAQGSYEVTWREQKTFQFQVSGPSALALSQKLTGEDLTDIKFMHFRDVTIAGSPVYAVRQGMAGEIGFEFHGRAEDAEQVMSAILETGEEFGIRRLGRRTAMINHLEASFPTGGWHYLKAPGPEGFQEWVGEHFDRYGLKTAVRGSFESDDLNDYLQSPVSMGWGKSVKFDHEFTGREALEKEIADPQRVRVTLEFNSEDVVDVYASLFGQDAPYAFLDIPQQQRWFTWADAVQDEDGAVVGTSTTPGYSYYFRKVLALAYVHPRYAEAGTGVKVLWGEPGTRQKLIRATVAPAPYKQDNRRSELGQVAV
ncbi:glycine cleavage T C-terminal barrel domain-containing protein [Arthrobacter sulfonylureivorans]|uniref:glycine cleavage T C-terminal barrel domain-containing protein n=1 Tax=Arthrobacter TaxID=1663 RepID=UPI0010AC5FB0|nr:glycine cleavage T C-terminal barrel domain-containing protein [Arthrobacter sp. CAU 1506]TJY66129.1 aminomethyl transferase family protein [Arthrobacter sp. CAU 1506]